MALSTPPPLPDASSPATANNASRPPFPSNPRLPPPPPSHPHAIYTATFFSPQIHPPPPHLLNSRLSSNLNFPLPHPNDLGSATNAAVLYPVASSGRGFIQKQPPPVTISSPSPNSHPHPNRPRMVSYPRPVFGYPHPDPGQGPGMGMGMGYVSGRPTHFGHPRSTVVMPGVINSVPIGSSQPQRKIVVSSNSIADCNGHRDATERSRDDSFVTIRDRKVRVSESASLYALCQSWLKNSSSEESQPVYMDAVCSLPRPLPLSAEDKISAEKKDGEKEEEEEEGSVENLTSEELLQMHVKRAKRVRSRLREERLRRIARYKTRLALLLPPMVEQQLRNDPAFGD